MLKRDAKSSKLETYGCCGRPFDPGTMGWFQLASNPTRFCAQCFSEEQDKRNPGWTQLVRAEVERSAA